MRQGHFFDAAEDFKSAAGSVDISAKGGQERVADIYFNMGNTLQVYGYLERAALAYNTSLTYRPDDPEALNNLATCYLWLDRLDEAEQAIEKAIEKRPNDPEGYTNRGLLHIMRQEADLAEVAYRRALSVDNDYARAHFNLARLYEQRKEYGMAAASYREYIRCWPEAPDARTLPKHIMHLEKRASGEPEPLSLLPIEPSDTSRLVLSSLSDRIRL